MDNLTPLGIPKVVSVESDKLKGMDIKSLKRTWEETVIRPMSEISVKAVAIIAFADANCIRIDWIPHQIKKNIRYVISGLVSIEAFSKFEDTVILKYLPKISISDQERLISKDKIEIVCQTPSGFTIEEKHINRLSEKEASQLFGLDELRTVKAQEKYIEEKKGSGIYFEKSRYRFVGGKVRFHAGTSVTVREIKKIISALENLRGS